MLSERRQQILEALIDEYVASASPVGSRTLMERYPLGVSSATIRNELSALEEHGFIAQPHTSAGRVPTDLGYRNFVDTLLDRMEQESSVPASQQSLSAMKEGSEQQRELRETASELDRALISLSSALSRFTDCLSVIMMPRVSNLTLHHISLVSLSERVIILVLIMGDGQVLHQHVELSSSVSPVELESLENALNNVVIGKSRVDLYRDRDLAALTFIGSPLLNELIDCIVVCMREAEHNRIERTGISALLAQPEFADRKLAAPLLRALDDNLALLDILGSVVEAAAEDSEGRRTTVRIGHENGDEELADLSVVAQRFGGRNSNESAGVVAVVGPTRMRYERALRGVRETSDTLERSFGEDSGAE